MVFNGTKIQYEKHRVLPPNGGFFRSDAKKTLLGVLENLKNS